MNSFRIAIAAKEKVQSSASKVAKWLPPSTGTSIVVIEVPKKIPDALVSVIKTGLASGFRRKVSEVRFSVIKTRRADIQVSVQRNAEEIAEAQLENR